MNRVGLMLEIVVYDDIPTFFIFFTKMETDNGFTFTFDTPCFGVEIFDKLALDCNELEKIFLKIEKINK